MKKLFILLLAVLFCLTSCAGIGDGLPKGETSETTDSSPEFELFYEISKREFKRGETVTIKASVENVSGRDLTYTAIHDTYYPSIELYSSAEGTGVATKLSYEPIDTSSGGSVEFTAKAGQIGNQTYTFILPTDARLGTYDVTLNYREVSKTFTDVLVITDNTSQNENSEYEYSPVSVSSGGVSVNPVRALGSCFSQYADGTFSIGDGMGAWKYLGETDISTYPILVYDGDIKMEIPEYNDVYNVGIYGLDLERINGYNTTAAEEINYLPAGEYIIILSVQYNTKTLNPNEYVDNGYDDFFRLSVPSKNTGIDKKYSYSSVIIESGGEEISPIRVYSYSSYYKDGEGYEADGLGAYAIFTDSAISPDDFPILVYSGEKIDFSSPENVTLGMISVYDLNYVSMPIRFSNLYELSKLPIGDYIIVFNETERGDGLTSGYDSIFRFIVTQSTSSHPGYSSPIILTRYDWSGYGVSRKTIEPCYLSYTIIELIYSLSLSENKSEIIAEGDLADYGNSPPVERGTSWVEIGSNIYRFDPEITEIALVETHLGAGSLLSAESPDLGIISDLLHAAWYYHPYDYYSGSYDNSTGNISIDRMYEAESDVEINVKSFIVEKEFNSVNSVTLEITAKADVDLRLVLDSRQSDDNLGAGDLKEFSMKKGETQTVTLSFSGWQYSYWIYIKADNTMVSVQIKP